MSEGKVELSSIFHAGPVTSLAFHSDTILFAGHGPFLKVFFVPTGELLISKRVLQYNRLHRIVMEPYTKILNNNNDKIETRRIVVYGSKMARTLTLQVLVSETLQLPRIDLHLDDILGPLRDWIMDIQWIFESEENAKDSTKEPTHLAIAFAHNFVEILHLPTQSIVYNVQCSEHCILYSARFHNHTFASLILAAGTVFNEVHIWPIMGVPGIQHEASVLYRLVGHEGVIFGVQFSNDGKLIVSVSDDRTIRIWRLGGEREAKHEAREIGIKSVVIWGHTARVWSCVFAGKYLVSISEDATCRVWKTPEMHGSNEDLIECLACWEGHSGRNVWSIGISPNNRIAATGGQDSGIWLRSLSSISDNKIDSESQLSKINLPPLRTYHMPFPGQPATNTREFMRNFTQIDLHNFVVATHYGYILKYNHPSRIWTRLHHDPILHNYTMMQASHCGNLLVCGSIFGDLIVVSVTGKFPPVKTRVHEEKVFEVHPLSSHDPNVLWIISDGIKHGFFLSKFDMTDLSQPVLKTVYKLEIPPSILADYPCITASALLDSHSMLFCGTRDSDLFIFRIPPFPSSSNVPLSLSAIIHIREMHGCETLTSIAFKDTSTEDSLMFWTTGRDGAVGKFRMRNLDKDGSESKGIPLDTLRAIEENKDDGDRGEEDIIEISKEPENQKKIDIEKLYHIKITKGWLEKAEFIDDELLLTGFYRKRLFVYNETKRYEMLSVACGGAHRRWFFQSKHANLNLACVSYMRKESIFMLYREKTAFTEGFAECQLQETYHGREVRTIKFLDFDSNSISSDSQPLIVFATAGEDNLFKIFQYFPEISEIRNICSIRNHSSVIRSIAWSRGYDLLLFTSGGAEELCCWKVEMTVPSPEKSILNNQRTEPLINVSCLEWAWCHPVSDIPETRIMDSTAFPLHLYKGFHFVGAVYSDSVMRLWLFDAFVRKFVLIADGRFHEKCILQVKHIIINGHQPDGILIFTSATDGRIAIWDVGNIIQSFIQNYIAGVRQKHFNLSAPAMSYSAHLSGVNCLDISQISDERYMIATGGDDNALAVMLFDIFLRDGKLHFEQIGELIKCKSGHGSSLQGIYILNNTVISTSVDQRLNMWRVISKNSAIFSLEMIASQYVDIADLSGMDATRIGSTTVIAVTGIGLQMFSLI